MVLIGLPAAIQFLTRIPVRLRHPPALTTAVPWFPLVGAFVGAVVGGTAAVLWHVTTPLVAGTTAVLIGVLVTGAFHEDGLADVADAFAGGWTVERRMEILKDPRHGSYGVAALSGSVVVRSVALGSIAAPASMLWSCIAAHAVARAAAVVLMGTVPVARPDGLGAEYARDVSRRRAVAGALTGVALVAIALGVRFGSSARWLVAVSLVVASAAAGALVIAWLALRKIRGVTGDVLGAAEQVVECLALVVLASTRLA